MSARSRLPFTSRVVLVRVRLRWLAALPVALLWACAGGSSGSGATSLAVSPNSAQLESIGETVQFTAEVRDQNGNAIMGVTVAWSSDATGVATVDASGLVTAVGAGTATVTATAGALSASAAVTVELPPEPPPPVATSLTISPASAQPEGIGETVQFTAEVRDQNGNAMPDVSVAWSSDAAGVAAVDASGLVTAVGAGTATVTATAGALSASATVTIEAQPGDASTGAARDRQALVALYESTGGEDWVNSVNWLSDRPLQEWHGINVDEDGRIIHITMQDNGLEGSIPPQLEQLTALSVLNLGFNRLSGSIPPQLGNLSGLSILALYGNGLSGPIPPEIANLSGLTFLSLTNNRLSGPIPAELGGMRNLEILELFDNELSGPIPGELGSLARLSALQLNRNRLTGPIPPELGSLQVLEYLSLGQNGLSGPIPPELGGLSALQELDLSDNDLQGVFPVELTGLPLRRLRWSGNPDLCMPLAAAYTAWLDAMVEHDSFDYCNRSDRAALDALYESAGGSGWTNAEGWPDGAPDSRYGVRTDPDGRVIAIHLSDNGLVGELPLALGDLASLTELRLGGNPELSGRLPYSLPRLEALSELSYAGTGLCVPREDFLHEWLGGVAVHEGTGVDCAPSEDRDILASLYRAMDGPQWFETTNWLSDAPLREWHGVDADAQGRVTRLDLTHNGLVGAIPADIVALERLTELVFIGIDTKQAPIPPELGELANLTTLRLAGIRAAGPIPPQLGKLARLRILELADNALSGPIPPELGSLGELAELHLDNNRLVGSVPQQLGNASALEQIHIANNELSGALPTSLAGLSHLWILDLSGNRFSDYLPAAFGDFARLEYLNLSYNALFGAIPAELGRLGSLRELYIGGNALSGPVPPELGGLSNLHSLALSGNAEMEGPLPESLAGLRELSHLQAIGTKLCAPPDAALLAWLDGLLTRRVPRCGFEPAAAYLTQAIQSRELPIALVAGEEALLRVFPTAAQTNSERIPEVRATFYLNEEVAQSLNIPGQPGPIPTELDEGSLDFSVNATVPAEVVQQGLEMTIEIDPDGTLDDGLGVTRRIPETGRLAVEVRSMPRFDITFVPFVWETNPHMAAVELTNAMEADPEGHEMLSLVRTLLPVGEISVTAHAPVRTSTNAAHELLEQTRLIATMEGGSGYYMGLASGAVEGASGIADLGQPIAFSIADAGVIAHEFGHNLSLQHTPCGNPLGIEPAYPYPEASPGGWGYDFSEQRLVSPDEYVDLMSYCSPYWVSDFSFDKALRYRLHSAGRLRTPEIATAMEHVSSLLIWGGVDAGAQPVLEPALVVEAPPALPRAPGPYRIAGATTDGTVLFDFSFDMPIVAHGDGRSGFAFALPVEAVWEDALASITLSGPRGSVTMDQDTYQPLTVLRNGPNGQVTGIVREPAAAEALRGTTEPGLYSRGLPETDAWSR